MRLLLRIISIIVLFFVGLWFCFRAIYSPKIFDCDDNLNLIQKYKLTEYISEHIPSSIDKPQHIVIILNESMCTNNLYSAYKIVSENHPNYISIVFESRNVNFNKSLLSIKNLCKANGFSYYIDSDYLISNIVESYVYPYALLVEDTKVVEGFSINDIGYEFIDKVLSSFNIWW